MFGKIVTVVMTAKDVHSGLYKSNEKYKETVNKGVDDVVSVAEFGRRCAADWIMWATTGVENGGRNA